MDRTIFLNSIAEKNIDGSSEPKKSGDGILGDIIHEAHSAIAWVALKGELTPKPSVTETEGDKKFLVFAMLDHEHKAGDAHAARTADNKHENVIDPAEWLDNKIRRQVQPQTA